MSKIDGDDAIPKALLACLPAGGTLIQNTWKQNKASEQLPSRPGSYLLLIKILSVTTIEWRASEYALRPGWYLYAGSARGPGGMRARVLRHMRAQKRSHWHIDKITRQTTPTAAICYTTQDECGLVADLAADLVSTSTTSPAVPGDFDFPLPGFGSSDCKNCNSHFLAWRGAG